MRYGNVEFIIVADSLAVTKVKAQIVRHYPGTNQSDSFDLGKPPTIITCQAVAHNDEERILLESLFHNNAERELHFNTHYYKRVKTGQNDEPKPLSTGEKKWSIGVEFIALDPIPYSTATGEALY